MEKRLFVGVDVQLSRPRPFAVLNERGRAVKSGWVASGVEAAGKDLFNNFETSTRARDSMWG